MYRGPRMGRRILSDRFHEAVPQWRDSDLLDDAEKLALEFAHLIMTNGRSIIEQLLEKLTATFTPAEFVDLGVMMARHCGFGQLTSTLQFDTVCEIATSRGSHVIEPAGFLTTACDWS